MEIKAFSELTTTELYEILRLRHEVFIEEQNCTYQDLDGKDQKAWHLLGWENHRLVTYLRILPQGVSYEEPSIGRVISHPDYRGKGLSRAALLQAIQFIKTQLKTSVIRISAQSHLYDFYHAIGFTAVSDEYIEAGVPHVQMVYGLPDRALLIIDVQKAMFECYGGVHKGELVLETLETLIEAARAARTPVVYVQHHEPMSEFAHGTATWEIHDRIAPKPGDRVIEKMYPDAFYKTNLHETLIKSGIRQLMVVGMQTEYCMDTTIRNGFSRGYKQVGVKNGHTTFDMPHLSGEMIVAHHEQIWNGRFMEVLELEEAKQWLADWQ